MGTSTKRLDEKDLTVNEKFFSRGPQQKNNWSKQMFIS